MSGTMGWGSIGAGIHNQTMIERYKTHGHQTTVLYLDSGGEGPCSDSDGDGIDDDSQLGGRQLLRERPASRRPLRRRLHEGPGLLLRLHARSDAQRGRVVRPRARAFPDLQRPLAALSGAPEVHPTLPRRALGRTYTAHPRPPERSASRPAPTPTRTPCPSEAADNPLLASRRRDPLRPHPRRARRAGGRRAPRRGARAARRARGATARRAPTTTRWARSRR